MRHMSIVKPCPPKWKFEQAAKLNCSNPFKDLLIKIQLSKAFFVKGLKSFEIFHSQRGIFLCSRYTPITKLVFCARTREA